VNENFNTGWRATLGRTELRAVRLDGWKQGWLVPKETKGVVQLTYTPDRSQLIAVVEGLNLLLVLLLVAVWPAWDRRRPGPRGRRALVAGTGWPAWAAVGLAAALGGWIAGVPGLAVTAAVAIVCGWARTRRSRTLRALASRWTVVLAMIAGTVCLAVGDWLDLLDNPSAPSGVLGDIAPQLLGLVIVGRVTIGLWPGVVSDRKPGRHIRIQPSRAFKGALRPLRRARAWIGFSSR
jgi:arabinofuranan 3-O-arabinosyltransferase